MPIMLSSPARAVSRAWIVALAAAAAAPPALAIGNGTASADPRAVVKIEIKLADGTYGMCSGTLVTPNWVLTANHCVTGRTLPCLTGEFVEDIELDPDCIGDTPAAGCFTVVFPGDGSSNPAGATAKRRGVVEVAALADPDDQVNMCDGDEVEKDVALLRLRSGTNPAIQPIHPPILDGNACPTSGDFTARIMGYGPQEFDFESPDETRRRYYEDGGWHRNTSLPSAGVYYKAWNLTPYLPGMEWIVATTPLGIFASTFALDALLNYDGMHGGDSGGPIFYTDGQWDDPDDLAICGTASRSWVEINGVWDGMCFPSPYCSMLQIANHYSALDNPSVQGFLEDHLVSGGAFDCESGPDGDGDGAVDDCDLCAGGSDFVDSDSDGTPDGCDVCPGYDDEDDDDEDGVPLGCDVCPEDGNVEMFKQDDSSAGDWDNDGWCNSEDNCPYAPNSDQGNRNLRWELAYDLHQWGDACDPIPTVRASSPEPILLDDSLASLGLTAYTAAEITLEPRKSTGADDGETLPGTSVTVPDVPTHLRFCLGDPSMDCLQAANLLEAPLYPWTDPGVEVPGAAWHPIQLAGRALGEALVLDYDNTTKVTETWDYVADYERWTTQGILDIPETTALVGTKAEAMDGYVWFHATTDVGAVDYGTGLHGLIDAGNSVVGANSVLAIDPEFVVWDMPEVPELGLPPFLDLYWLGDPPYWVDLVGGALGRLYGREQVVATRVGAGLLHDGGLAQDLTPFVGAGLGASLSAGYVWSGAVDQPAEGEPLAMAMSADGTWLVEGLWRSGDHLLGATDDELETPLIGAAGPSADRGFTTLYSPRLRSVYRVGGGSGELWRGDLRYGAWTLLATDLGDVRAATAVAGDRSIYVVRTSERETELVAYDAMTGIETILAAWSAPVREGSVLALTPDGTGGLLLTASSAAGYWSVLRVDPSSGEPPVLVDWDAGSLRGAPVVAERGALLHIVDRAGTVAVELDLDGQGEALRSWDELAELF